MRPPAALLLLLALTACAAGQTEAAAATPVPAASEAAVAPAGLDTAAATRLALAADDARRLAYSRADAAPVAGVYAPALLAVEARRLAGLAGQGVTHEEVAETRSLVHLSAGAGSGQLVLSVAGHQRVTTRGFPDRPWIAFRRQWNLELRWKDGAWLVSAAFDLPPDRWWR